MAIIYKIATVKIAETLATRGFAPPPYAISPIHSVFLLLPFFQYIIFGKKMQGGIEDFVLLQNLQEVRILNLKCFAKSCIRRGFFKSSPDMYII